MRVYVGLSGKHSLETAPLMAGSPLTYQCLLQCPLALEDEDRSRGAWRGRNAFSHLGQQSKILCVARQALGSFFPATGKSESEGSKDALEKVFCFHRTPLLKVISMLCPSPPEKVTTSFSCWDAMCRWCFDVSRVTDIKSLENATCIGSRKGRQSKT